MINDEKGMKLFQTCTDYIEFYERTLDEAIRGNSQLRGPSKHHKLREQFKKDYNVNS